jgi:hypothetical protein
VIDAVELEGLECNPLNFAFGDAGYLARSWGFDHTKSSDQNYQRQYTSQSVSNAVQALQKAKHDLFVAPILEEPRLAIMAAPLVVLLGPEVAVASTTDVAFTGVGLQLLDAGSETATQLIFNGGDIDKVDRIDVAAALMPGPAEIAVQSSLDWSGEEGFRSVFNGDKSIGQFLLEGTVGAAFHKTGEELLKGAPRDPIRTHTFEFSWDLFKTGAQEQGKKALQSDDK